MGEVRKYNLVARTLHWLIAAGIIGNVVLGRFGDSWKDIPWMPGTHKSIGMTVLVLSLARLGWRLVHSAPPLPSSMPGWQVLAARAVHALFYVMMIVVPLSGWIMASAGTYPLNWFGLFDIAKLPVAKDSAVDHFAHEGHEIMGNLFIPLIALHVAAALYHHYVVRDRLLRRML